MLLLYFILVGMVCGAPKVVTIDNYVLEIDNDTLMSIKTIGGPSNDLNLSGLGLRGIDKNVFDDLSYVKNLNLANNSLSILPEFVFSNLTSLERLSLADNAIDAFKNAFVGLNNLKCLNISNNPMRHLRKSYFFGLTKSTDILTHGNMIFTMEASLFENPFLRNDGDQEDDMTKKQTERILDKENTATEVGITNGTNSQDAHDPKLNKNLRVMICSHEGIVSSLEPLTSSNESELEHGCQEVKIDYEKRKIYLNKLGISRFDAGWYRLQDYPVKSLDISDNNIVDVLPPLLNDLPEGLTYVNLADNKIERLIKGNIVNEHLRLLKFMNNYIIELEDGALANTKLSQLIFHGNKLRNTSFMSTLPDTLTMIEISHNELQELSPGSFSTLKNLEFIDLSLNNVTKIDSESFAGLSSLQTLLFVKNGLRKIAPNSFKDLKELKTLYLFENNLTSLEKGTFNGLKTVEYINLSDNNLTKVTRDSLYGLSDSLQELYLISNQIDSVTNGTFVNVPSLRILDLQDNLLTQPDGDSFQGIAALEKLSLQGNGIKKIEKGIAKYLGRLNVLNLSENPITRLENGAFFGLSKRHGPTIHLDQAPIELIQGGLFDDV